jgi:uncharacterized protein DUF4340
MNARIALIFVVLLAVLGGAALVYHQQEKSRRPQNIGTLGQNLFKDLKAAEIASIRIVEPKATLTVRRKDERWVIAERADFPADLNKVREFVLQALSLKVGQSEPIGDKDRARLNLDESATQVEFGAADGKPLAKLLVGKKYFKREVENPEKARADGRFVALPGDPKTVYVVSDPLAQATTKSAEWIDKSSFQVEKVKTLEVRYPAGEGWRIERDGDNADWRLVGAKPGEKLEVTKANAASYSLGLLELADVAPKGTQIEAPVAIDATTLDGLAYSIKVGKLQGDNYPVSFTSSGTPRKDDKDAERLKKLEERLPREKVLSDYVLYIPKSKLEDTLKKRAELLEKKDEAKK